MNKSLDKFKNLAETAFSTPNFTNYKIRYVENRKDAEVCVTKDHSLADYLVLGFACLNKSVRDETGEIRVFILDELTTETVVVYQGNNAKKVEMNSELFLQICKPIDAICSALYDNSEKIHFFGFGLSVSMELMSFFSDIPTIPEAIMYNLNFENFEDTITAENNAFYILKKMYEATLVGYYYELTQD